MVVAIGYMLPDGSITVHTGEDNDERDLLVDFWTTYRGLHPCTLVGFNSFGYDIPVLLRRSRYLGIDAPNISLDRYRSPHIDLMQRLSFNGAIRAHSLSFYSKRHGIEQDDPYSGKDIAALVAAGDWAAVRHHCYSDVKETALLAVREGVLPQVQEVA